jgi:hypothetical protein
MADGLAVGLVSNWLNTLRSGGAAYTNTATWVQLHVTGGPGAAGTTNISVGSTTRLQATLNASSGGSALALSGAVGPWTNGGTTETLTDITVWTASTAGTFLFSVALTSSKAWGSADTFSLNSLSVALTPQAA